MQPMATAPGLIGKIPAEGDFVRFNAGDPAAQEFTDWLAKGQESVHRNRESLPRAPSYFLFTGATATNALIGVLIPSKDRVGREFPLAAFTAIRTGDLAHCFALVPLAFSQFLTATAGLLEAAATLAGAEVEQRLAALPLPTAEAWSVAEENRLLLLSRSCSGIVREVSEPGGSCGGAYYAFRTFSEACSRVRWEEPAKARLVLDCPLSWDGPVVWLELAERLLQWKKQPPSFLWTDDLPPRLLLSLGPMSPGTLSCLASQLPTNSSFWPVKTTQQSAIETARRSLSNDQRRAIENSGSTLETLFSYLAR